LSEFRIYSQKYKSCTTRCTIPSLVPSFDPPRFLVLKFLIYSPRTNFMRMHANFSPPFFTSRSRIPREYKNARNVRTHFSMPLLRCNNNRSSLQRSNVHSPRTAPLHRKLPRLGCTASSDRKYNDGNKPETIHCCCCCCCCCYYHYTITS